MNKHRTITLLGLALLASAATALEQPAQTPKKDMYLPASQNVPPLAWVVARKPMAYPVYGIYTWFGEYAQLREQIKRVGWKTLRIGGPVTDENMKMLFDDGLNFAMMIGGPKGKRDAFDSDAAYIEASVKAANELLDRLGDGGSFYRDFPEYKDRFIPFFMLRNEPNFHYMFKAGDESQREALYSALAPKLIELIKRRSPRSQVISFTAGGAGAGDMRFVKNVLAIDPRSLTEADVFSTHPYVHPAPPEADKKEKWGSYSMANSLAVLRKTFARYGRGDIPVWYTEGGWTISNEDGGAYKSNKANVPILFHAAYTCRYYARALRLGVDCVTVMFITDTDGHAGGFFDRQNQMAWRPSAHAVQTMIRLMPHPKLIAAQADGEDQNYIYEFKSHALRPDSPVVIMAYRIEGAKTVSIKAPYDKAVVTDMLGGTRELNAADGAVRVEIGPFPVYIRQAE